MNTEYKIQETGVGWQEKAHESLHILELVDLEFIRVNSW
jgi:hypothetical protein